MPPSGSDDVLRFYAAIGRRWLFRESRLTYGPPRLIINNASVFQYDFPGKGHQPS